MKAESRDVLESSLRKRISANLAALSVRNSMEGGILFRRAAGVPAAKKTVE